MNILNIFKTNKSKEHEIKESEIQLIDGVDSDEHLYRSLSEKSSKDIPEYDYERSLKILYHLYLTNGFARRIIEIIKDFIIGAGITIEANEPKIKTLIDDFWFDYYNNFPIKQHKKVMELSLYGEQIYPVKVNPINGKVKLLYVDPLQLKTIDTEKNNIEEVTRLTLKSSQGVEEKKYDVIRYNEDTERLEGEAFFFRINNVSNAFRGVSDILPLIDWIDNFDQILFDETDRVRFLKSFIWDHTCKGMSEAEVIAFAKKQNASKPGMDRYHNDQVETKAVTPDLKTQDTTVLLKFVLEFMLGSIGIPGHYFGFGQQTNKSTAETMDMPWLKKIQVKQNYIKWMFSYIIDFVIDKAIEYGRQVKGADNASTGKITDKLDRQFNIILPEPSVKDLEKLINSLKSLGESLTLAINNDWISKETSAKVYAMELNELGQDVNYDDEKDKIENESKLEDENDVNDVAEYIK